MRLVKNNDIKLMNELYLKYGTYAEVAKQTGFSPSTVKKYIINGYQLEKEKNIIKYEKNLPEFNPSIFRKNDWGDLCVLSDEEKSEIRELWKELSL